MTRQNPKPMIFKIKSYLWKPLEYHIIIPLICYNNCGVIGNFIVTIFLIFFQISWLHTLIPHMYQLIIVLALHIINILHWMRIRSWLLLIKVFSYDIFLLWLYSYYTKKCPIFQIIFSFLSLWLFLKKKRNPLFLHRKCSKTLNFSHLMGYRLEKCHYTSICL